MQQLLTNATNLFSFSLGTLLLQSLLVVLAFHFSKSFIKLEMDKSKRSSTVLDFGMVLVFGIAISVIVPIIGTTILNVAVRHLHRDCEYLYSSYMELLIIFSVILVTSYALFAEHFKFVKISPEEANIIDKKFFRLAVISLIITALSYALVNASHNTEYRVACEYSSLVVIVIYCFVELTLAHRHISEMLVIKKTKTRCISAKIATLINKKIRYVVLFSIIYAVGSNKNPDDLYQPFTNINNVYLFLMVILIFQGAIVLFINKFISYTYSISNDGSQHSERLLQRRSANMMYICDFIVLSIYFSVFCYALQYCGMDIQKYVLREGFVVVVLGIFVTIMIGRIFEEFRDTILEKAHEGDEEHYLKLKTFAPTVSILFYVVLGITSVLIIMANLGINITPILASFSIFSAAFALAAQDVVKAFITGVTLLIEKNLFIGDTVSINGMKGAIEKLSVRVVHLRDPNGNLYIIPYNCISTITNHSKDYMKQSDSLRLLSYVDVEKAIQILHAVVDEMKTEEKYKDKIIGNVTVHGVQPFDLTGIKISWDVNTIPGLVHFRQDVYHRLISKFIANNIKIPTFSGNISIEEKD